MFVKKFVLKKGVSGPKLGQFHLHQNPLKLLLFVVAFMLALSKIMSCRYVSYVFGPNKILVQHRHLKSKPILSPQNFWSTKILGPKIRVQKFLNFVSKKGCQKNFKVQKKFVLYKILVRKF